MAGAAPGSGGSALHPSVDEGVTGVSASPNRSKPTVIGTWLRQRGPSGWFEELGYLGAA